MYLLQPSTISYPTLFCRLGLLPEAMSPERCSLSLAGTYVAAISERYLECLRQKLVAGKECLLFLQDLHEPSLRQITPLDCTLKVI